MSIVILTTGGTIAMRHSEAAGGAVPALDSDALSAEFAAAAPTVVFEEFCNVPSSHLTLEDLRRLRDRVAELIASPGISGVIVTHGTDTLEETAMLLDLTVPGDKPVIVTGAMRTAGEPGFDGIRNILDSVRTARSAVARGLGTLVVMNEEIHAARSVTKTHSLAVETFQSPGRGPLGRVFGEEVILDRRVERRLIEPGAVESRIALLKLVIGMGPEIIDAVVATGLRGLVIEAFGGGRIPPVLIPRVVKAMEDGITVAVTSRCVTGRLWDMYAYEGAFRTIEALGVLWAHGLNGQKARIQLAAVLGVTRTRAEAEALWRWSFSTAPPEDAFPRQSASGLWRT